jgi:hypothetical protein
MIANAETLIEFAALVVSVPSAAYAVVEFRRRPQLTPVVRFGDGLTISVLNAGRHPVVRRSFTLSLYERGIVQWCHSGRVENLLPGCELVVDDVELQLLSTDDSVLDMTVSLQHGRNRGRRHHGRGLLDPRTAQLFESGSGRDA